MTAWRAPRHDSRYRESAGGPISTDQRPLFARAVGAVVLLVLDAATAFLLRHDPPPAVAGSAISTAVATSAAIGTALVATIAYAGLAALRGTRHRIPLQAVIAVAALRVAAMVAVVCAVLVAGDVAVTHAKLIVLGASDAVSALLLAVSVRSSRSAS